MFELPRGKGEGTVSSIRSGLMSLSNKSCVGLDAHQKAGTKKIPAVAEFMFLETCASVRHAYMKSIRPDVCAC